MIGKTKFSIFLLLVTLLSAVHRTSHPACRPSDPPTASNDFNVSVTAVHHDAENVYVSLRQRVDLKHRYEGVVVAFTGCPLAHDSTVVVEPLIMPERQVLESSSSSVFRKILSLALSLLGMLPMVQ